MNEILKEFGQFRKELRQILHENGVISNPGWTENDIIEALRKLMYERRQLQIHLKEAQDLIYDVSRAVTLDEAWEQSERCYDYFLEPKE